MSDTLFDRLGGEPAMQAAVEGFYRRMLADDRVSEFFDDVDMDRQMAKQKAFLTFVCGGPVRYTGLDMRTAHAPLLSRGLNDGHVDVVIEHLAGTLRDLGVAEAHIAEVGALAESVRADVLGR